MGDYKNENFISITVYKHNTMHSATMSKNVVKCGMKSDGEAAMVARVASWIDEAIYRQNNGLPVFNPSCLNRNKIVAEICGVSPSNVKYCEGRLGVQKRKRGPKGVVLDDFDEKALGRLVFSFYTRSPPELPTFSKIHTEALKIAGFPAISISTLRKMLKKQGFAYEERNKKMHVFQREDINAQRHKYLNVIAGYREQGYTVYYQDETWVNANHTREYVWQYRGEALKELMGVFAWKGGLKVPCGSGKRLIINHLGSASGFVPNCQMVFKGEKGTADYHGEMNSVVFEKWWGEQVLPNVSA